MNRTEKHASTYTGASMRFIMPTGMRATAVAAITATANTSMTHHDATKKMPMEYASSAAIFTRASQAWTGVDPLRYVNIGKVTLLV